MNSIEIDKPLVSVWMITYNHEKYISQAIESVLMQKTNFKYELVIGEDCSTDTTPTIIKQFVKKYPDIIKAHYNIDNMGMIPNMIKTLKQCKGKYIAMLEGDDYWIDEYKLQKQFDILESSPQTGVVYTNYEKTHRDGSIKDHFYLNNMPQGLIFDKIMKGEFPYALTVLFRKNLLNEEFYSFLDDKEFMMGDYPLWLWLSYRTEFKYINDITSVYRFNADSVCNSQYLNLKKTLKFYKSWLYILDKFFSKNQITNTLLINTKNEVSKYRIFLLYQFYICENDKRNANKIYKQITSTYKKVAIKYKILYLLLYIPFGSSAYKQYYIFKNR